MTAIVQSIGFLAASLTVVSLVSFEKKNVLILGILAGLTWVLHLGLLKEYAFAALQAIILIRNVATVYTRVKYHTLITWILNIITIGIVYTVPSNITYMIGTVVILGNWITFRLQGWAFRAGLLSIDITFLIANIIVVSWGGILCSFICLLLNIRAVHRHLKTRAQSTKNTQILQKTPLLPTDCIKS